jgi:hypothetical protein
MPEAIRVTFEQLSRPVFGSHPIRVTVRGPFSRRGGAELEALVGRQALDGISFRADGSGFSGYLATRPSPGDALIVRRGAYEVDTGARVGAGAATRTAASESSETSAEDRELVAAVAHGLTRTLTVDAPRGVVRCDASGVPLALATARSYIIEGVGLTPDLRAFKPATRDKTGRITLSVRVPRLPAGGTICWSVPAANRGSITLSSNPATIVNTHIGARVEIIGLVPGLSNVDVEARDAAGRALESIKFPLCIPQFVLVEDSGAASQVVLDGFHLGDSKEQVFEAARQVCDRLLASANVRTVWNMPPFRERLPRQLESGGLASARLTIATIAGNPPANHPTRYGVTRAPYGPQVHNEPIDVYPGAFDAPTSGGAAQEVDDVTNAAVLAVAGDANMTTPEKVVAIALIGRLIGETLAHEIVHSLAGPTLAGPGGHHNPPAGAAGATPSSLMNAGVDRSLTDRTGLRPIASPIALENVVDDGIAAINVPTGVARTQIDRHFPVPPVFA